MTPLLKKMNFKEHETAYVLNAPDSFLPELKEIGKSAVVKTRLTGAKQLPFFIGFVTKQKEVDELAKAIGPLVQADEVIWFAYPKGTSRSIPASLTEIPAGRNWVSWDLKECVWSQ